ncbi:MAG: hypothetical protein IJD46_01850 [Bacilli bacterium]|nr:hypothetical protein [Bacilli bacterium]
MKKILPGICMLASLFFVGTLTSCNEKPCEHQEELVKGKAATCTETGLTDGKKCSVCQETLVAQEEIPALGHTEEKVEAKAPTCTEEGNVAYTHCSACDKNFDLEGKELENVVVDALGHTEETVEAKAPTCTEEGNIAYTHCSVCDKNFDSEGKELENVVVDALGHTKEPVEAKAPTCTEEGNIAYTHCSVCNKNFDSEGKELENVVIEALGHKYIDGECECGDKYTPVLSGEWTLVTEIKDGDQVLIGAPAYGKLLSVEKVATFYNKGVEYSATDFTNVTDKEIFVVTVNSDGSYTFTSVTGVVIALADSYSSLNETGNNKAWTLEEKGNGIFYLKNTVRGNYLEWYDSKGNWSSYATSNLSDLFELSFYARGEATDGEHIHNYISSIKAATCTEDGLATYTCSCGDSFTKVLEALGHSYENGRCDCGELDPEHEHSYTSEEVAPTCQVVGHTKYTCLCGDTYTVDGTELAEHVDANLDITCDYEGCTKRILPAGDSKISLFTANHMIIVSLNSSYYVEGVVTEITDAKNGVFIITDEAGDHILIRLPKNAEGQAYSAWTSGKVVVGDTVSVYGKPTRNTGSPATEKAKVEGGLLTVLKHEHVFSEATCTKPSVCDCLAQGQEALGHADENADNACDRCNWNMKLATSNIVVATDTTLANGVLAEDETHWTWSNENFDVIIAKGSSTFTLYKTAKAYMQLKKQNTLTVESKNGLKMQSVTISVTSESYLTKLEQAIASQYEFTSDVSTLTLTITLDAAETFVLENQGTSTIYVNGVEVVYEK